MKVQSIINELPSIARFDPDSIPDKVWVTTLLPPGSFDGYQNPAIHADICAGQWMGRAALEPLYADESTPASSVIEVVQNIPSALRAAMDDYPIDAIGPDGYGPPSAMLKKSAAVLGGKVLRVALAQPGEANTTVAPLGCEFEEWGLRAGFHLDSQDLQPLADRADSRRRFIPSRGPGMRIAAVCFPDIVTVGRILGFPEDESPGYDIYRDYLHQYPLGAICVGIPVWPYQGSLVNTDLVVHDGMTIGATQESTTFQILGNWKRGELGIIK